MRYIRQTLADPGALLAPPQWDPILSFLHMFPPKSTRVGGRCPPRAGAPTNGKSWIRHRLRVGNLVIKLFLKVSHATFHATESTLQNMGRMYIG